MRSIENDSSSLAKVLTGVSHFVAASVLVLLSTANASPSGGISGGGGDSNCADYIQNTSDWIERLKLTDEATLKKEVPELDLTKLTYLQSQLRCLPVENLNRDAWTDPNTKTTQLLTKKWSKLIQDEKNRLSLHELNVLAGLEKDGDYHITLKILGLKTGNVYTSKFGFKTKINTSEFSADFIEPYVNYAGANYPIGDYLFVELDPKSREVLRIRDRYEPNHRRSADFFCRSFGYSHAVGGATAHVQVYGYDFNYKGMFVGLSPLYTKESGHKGCYFNDDFHEAENKGCKIKSIVTDLKKTTDLVEETPIPSSTYPNEYILKGEKTAILHKIECIDPR